MLNEILFDVNEWGGNFVVMVLEEMEMFFLILVNYLCGEYLFVFDLFDGLLNIDVNVLIGMIFLVLCCLDGK